MSFTTRALVTTVAALLGLAVGPAIPSTGSAQLARTVASTAQIDGVVVIVEGIRSDAGSVIGGIYDRASTWLGENRSIEDCHASISHGRARCVFHEAPAGNIAFAAMHDEDSDGELDRDFIGLPSEGYAFSNDVRDPFGPPSFAAASFSTARTTPFVVHMRYGI